MHRCYSWRTNHSRFPVLFLHSSSLFRSNGVVARYLCPPFSLFLSLSGPLSHSLSLVLALSPFLPFFLSRRRLLSLPQPYFRWVRGKRYRLTSTTAALSHSFCLCWYSTNLVTAPHSSSRFSTSQARRCRLARLVHNILPRRALGHADERLRTVPDADVDVPVVVLVVVVRVVVARGEVVVAVVVHLLLSTTMKPLCNFNGASHLEQE